MKTPRIIGVLLVLASAAGCEREAGPTAPGMVSNAATGNADGRIAFASTRDGPYFDIWLMNADGSGVTRLTDSRPFLTSSSPAWSAGAAWCGDRIAFHSNRGMGNDIYVMNADGTGVTQLTDAPGSDITPTWAPACDRLAF